MEEGLRNRDDYIDFLEEERAFAIRDKRFRVAHNLAGKLYELKLEEYISFADKITETEKFVPALERDNLLFSDYICWKSRGQLEEKAKDLFNSSTALFEEYCHYLFNNKMD